MPGVLRYSSDLIDFWSCSNEFPLFSGLWLVEQFLRICQQNPDQIGLKFDEPTHYGPPQAWLTFGYAPVNLGHFSAFADKLLISLGWKWLANSLGASPGLINFWSKLKS